MYLDFIGSIRVFKSITRNRTKFETIAWYPIELCIPRHKFLEKVFLNCNEFISVEYEWKIEGETELKFIYRSILKLIYGKKFQQS